jgi:hypothetical protein
MPDILPKKKFTSIQSKYQLSTPTSTSPLITSDVHEDSDKFVDLSSIYVETAITADLNTDLLNTDSKNTDLLNTDLKNTDLLNDLNANIWPLWFRSQGTVMVTDKRKNVGVISIVEKGNVGGSYYRYHLCDICILIYGSYENILLIYVYIIHVQVLIYIHTFMYIYICIYM